MLFESDEMKPGSGGQVSLWADEDQIGDGKLDHTVPIAFTSYAGMDIGCDNGLVVDLAYEDRAPYPFTGKLDAVTFDLKPLTHEQAEALHEHEHHHSIGSSVAG
jgi:arylsulfatase